jgi:hypothetical protein
VKVEFSYTTKTAVKPTTHVALGGIATSIVIVSNRNKLSHSGSYGLSVKYKTKYKFCVVTTLLFCIIHKITFLNVKYLSLYVIALMLLPSQKIM